MALKGLDIFKLSPKKNCKECGSPTCMAFCMKVAQGAVAIDKCPYFSEEAKAKLSEATAPPMKTLTVGSDIKIWRDISCGADEARLDADAASALEFERYMFETL